MTTPTSDTRTRIVVGVDGSESSIKALIWADRLSAALNAELDIVMTWHYPVNYAMAVGLSQWDPAADAAVLLATAISAAFGTDVPAGLQTTIREGHPARILLTESSGAEMLVVGSRGHGGFTGLLIGSVSAYCAEHADCPVLVIHDKR